MGKNREALIIWRLLGVTKEVNMSLASTRSYNYLCSRVRILLGGFFEWRYFHINSITKQEKLEAAVVCLEGKAFNGY